MTSPAKTMALKPTGQLSLFAVLDQYGHGTQDNDALYASLVDSGAITHEDLGLRRPMGHDRREYSTLKQRVRWFQQDLKRRGLLEPVAGKRGHWGPTGEGRRTISQRQQELEPAMPGIVRLGFSTELGMALWADCKDAAEVIDQPISCILTSPPYPLAKQRDYGGPARNEWVDWLCACLEPLVKRMVPGATLFLNVSNDIFTPRSPERSLYQEHMVLALHQRLGLRKMDMIPWHNPSKAPGPLQWASLRRVQLNATWEPVYYFTNDPQRCIADNRRVLQPHTETHAKLIASGGAKSAGVFGDGANRRKVGAFSNQTDGAILRNLLRQPHRCPSQRQMRSILKEMGIPLHSATMPLSVAKPLVEFGCPPGHLTVDPFGGWATTALACQLTGRQWAIFERMRAYLHAARLRFLLQGMDVDEDLALQ